MSRLVIMASWEDCAHLSEDAKADMLLATQPYLREARRKGIPHLGSGAIYPFRESELRVDDMVIPDHWVRAFGADTALAGTTAAVWGAMDLESDKLYIYSVYRREQAETAVHAEAIKARGAWIPGVADAAAIADSDRVSFLQKYRSHGLNVSLPDKSVDLGIQAVYERMSTGRLKIFGSCYELWEELRLYRRDQKGKIVKGKDHSLDALRYLVFSGIPRMIVQPKPRTPDERLFDQLGPTSAHPRGWMM